MQEKDDQLHRLLVTASDDHGTSPDIDKILERPVSDPQPKIGLVVGIAFAAATLGLLLLISPILKQGKQTPEKQRPAAIQTGLEIPAGRLLLAGREGVEILDEGSPQEELISPNLVAQALSPDGTRVVATVEQEVSGGFWQSELVLVEIATRSQTSLVTVSSTETLGAPIQWSPGGSEIAYRLTKLNAQGGDPLEQDVCIVAVSSGASECYTDNASVDSFDWAPDGSSLLIGNEQGAIDVLDPASATIAPLVDAHLSSQLLIDAGFSQVAGFTNPQWSASGAYFAARVDGSPGGDAVAVFDIAGNVIAVGEAGMPDYLAFAWSPGVDQLAYSFGSQSITSPDAVWTLHLMTLSPVEDVAVTDSQSSRIGVLLWSTSGEWIVVATISGIDEVLLFTDPTGQHAEESLGLGQSSASLVAWGPKP